MSLEDSAVVAEQMRADLADFFGRPIGGLPVALDFVQAMHLSRTSQDFAGDREAIKERWSWRCPNPHLHKAIVEAGGTCPKARVQVKEHVNGPRGRGLDNRRTARISTISTKAGEPG